MSDTRLRILIVDDETLARRRLRDVLADNAAVLPADIVGEAANGKEAIEQQHVRLCGVQLLDRFFAVCGFADNVGWQHRSVVGQHIA